MNEFIPILIAFLGGSGVSAVLNYLFNRKNLSDEQMQKFLDRYEDQILRKEEEVRDLKDEIQRLRTDFDKLRQDYDLLNSLHLDIPLPLCVVTKDGTLQKYNGAYYSTYLQKLKFDRDEAKGMHLVEIFGADIGLEYLKGWETIHKTREAIIFAERVLNDIDDKTNVSYQKFIKYPLFAGEATYAGVLIAYEEITEEEYRKFKPKRLKYYR